MSLAEAAKMIVENRGASVIPEAIGFLNTPNVTSNDKKREKDNREDKTEIFEGSSGDQEFAVTYPEDWTDEKLAEFFTSVLKQARDARAYKESIRDEVWDLYNNLQDFSQKADWQAKEVRPKVFMMVETVVAFIQLGLFKLKDWFDVVPVNSRNPNNKVKAFIAKQILKFYTSQKEFVYEVLTALKWGFLSELFIFKVWEGEETKYTIEPVFLDNTRQIDQSQGKDLPTVRQRILRRRRVMYAAINPSFMFLDWTGKEGLVIEEGKMSIAEYAKLVEDGLMEDHVDEIMNSTGQTLTDVKEQRKKENVTQAPNTYYKEFTYHEFWGDVYDEKGKYVFKNIHFIIADKKYVIVKPESITFFDGENPYVIAPCISVPGSVYHKSLIEPIAGVAKMMTELFDLTLDALFATILNVIEIDVDRVLNAEDLDNGIGPNTVIQKTGPEKVLDVTQFGKMPGEAFVGLEYLQRTLEEDTAISRGMIGMPTTSKRQTKGEVQTEQLNSITFFQALMQNIENNFLAPVLEKIWARVLQFPHELSHPKLADLIGEEAASILNKMTAEERYDVINGHYEIRVTGLSGLIAKREMLQNILTYIRIIARSPDMMSTVDPMKLGFEILDLLNIDPQSIMRDKPQLPLNAKQTKPPGNNARQQSAGAGGGMGLQQLLQMISAAKSGGGALTTNGGGVGDIAGALS